MSYTKKEEAFLIELEALTRSHQISIGGCGCCSSPYLTHIGPEDLLGTSGYGSGQREEVLWVSKADSYDWANYRDTIVKRPRPPARSNDFSIVHD